LLPDICFKNKYESLEKLKFVTIPGLFISGLADSMIPVKDFFLCVNFSKNHSLILIILIN
jgi:hypothetical protein